MIPPIDDVLDGAHVLSMPMRTKFRGITTREVMLVRGPAGWGEFSPFPEYDDVESAPWLASAIEAAWDGPPSPLRRRIPVNATVPAVAAAEVASVLSRSPGAETAKVKVAEKGQTLADDVARVRAVRELVPRVRVDANGGWTVDEAIAALTALTADGPLEYAEQPCATVAELVELRRRAPGVRVAADESIRRAEDPMKVVRAGGADIAVLKVAPLGGMRAVLELAGELGEYGVPVVVSSALDSAVGISSGLAAAAALPHLEFACGLGTGALFVRDVAPAPEVVDGTYPVGSLEPDPRALIELDADADRTQWWIERVRRCHALLR
ncbi:O-succinylbenzoate synthase [Rhodococcus sp. 06-462-5]|nr:MULTISPECIES: o-succinylbenzoate synthase [unclassified Rhodococcus (in: high G+C Gram-positive bacteria)]OZC76661.1 O-succinylbenzoate synthase [Rhodococcus sp. 06-462-5]OZE64718.1 O-succinylbenzoate synthase [Rhodococcus sp. 02-925g]